MTNSTDIHALLNKALQLHKAKKFKSAHNIYIDILNENPNHATAWHQYGLTTLELEDNETALTRIKKALALEPNNAIFLHNIAFVYCRLGQLDKARESYQKALAIQPDYAEAYFNYSSVMKFRKDPKFINNIRRLLRKKTLSDKNRCFLHFSAGKYYDDIQDYSNAFNHYLKANHHKKVQYDPQEMVDKMARIKEVFSSALLKKPGESGNNSQLPIFVVGMPRSGTSLVEQILSSHPSIFGAGEIRDIQGIAAAFPKHCKKDQDYPECIPTMDKSIFSAFANAYLKRMHQIAPDAAHVINKLPGNFIQLGLITLLFPNAKVIHCRRHPLDTCLSCFFNNFKTGQEFSFNLDDLAHFYHSYETMMAYWNKVLPKPIFEIRYEDLIADPEKYTRQLIDHCGIPWDDACLNHHQTERSVHTASLWQVRQPLYKTSLARWQHYEAFIQPLKNQLASSIASYE